MTSAATATPSADVVCAVECPLLDMLLSGLVVALVLDSAVGTEDRLGHGLGDGPGGTGFAYLLADKLAETGGAYLLVDKPGETGEAYLLADNPDCAGVAYLLADNPEGVGPRALLLGKPRGCCVVEGKWFLPLENWLLDVADAYLLAVSPPYFGWVELCTSVPICIVGISLFSWLGGAVVHLSSTPDFGMEADLGSVVFTKALEASGWSVILFQWFFEASGTVLIVSLTDGGLMGRAALRNGALGGATAEEVVVSLRTAELDLEADRDVAVEAKVFCISTGFT